MDMKQQKKGKYLFLIILSRILLFFSLIAIILGFAMLDSEWIKIWIPISLSLQLLSLILSDIRSVLLKKQMNNTNDGGEIPDEQFGAK